ncbi:MAG: bacteriorhodopsin [Actinobacteria bacterium]|nr:bacteriorhodopsin [Actinomycetota bacterium]MDA2952209.1 bacteriorhodopsin [Actinomycetota bacterium]MDA2999145.1 bacteriorhodopsin [Actinomycetota bacterium]
MTEATGLVVSNYNLVYNALSFATATLGIAFVFFLISRSRVSANYRSAVTMSAVICGVAGYHYWRMFENFAAGTWNEGYRYADWLLTVPLLVAELVVVAGVSKEVAKKITPRLVVAALLMIAAGYPGEVAEHGSTERYVWFFISLAFMLYVLYELFAGTIGKTLKSQTGEIGKKLNNLRYVLVVTWTIYPIFYLLGDSTTFVSEIFSLSTEESATVIQVGYSISDILAKAGYGLLILGIATARSDAEGYRAA